MTIFIKPVGADLQIPVSKVTVAAGDVFSFIKEDMSHT